MGISNLLLKLNLSMNSTARRAMWKVSLLLLFLALIVYVLSQPMQASYSGFATEGDPAAAQQAIACGQTLTGNITALGQQDTYTFNGNAGEVVSIAVVTTSGNLCAWAELYNPAGAPIANLGGTCNSLFRAQLPATGTYTILVRDYSINRTGAYNLNLQFATGRCAEIISCGQIKNGQIARIAEQDTYTFSGNAGEVVSITVVTTAGDLCAWAELYNPAGTAIANLGGTCNSLFRAQLPATGNYTILVRDYSVNRTGAYNLNLQFATGRCAGTISCGQTKNGEIAEKAEQDIYNFSGNAGEVVSIAVVTTSGDLCAWAELYNPAGTAIANLGGTCNSLFRAQLPATGNYTILVRDYSVNRTGAYNLNLQFATGRCAETISCGQVKNGEIVGKAEQDIYTFCGVEGSSVSIAVTTTSGDLCAWAELYNPAGTAIANLGGTCNSLFRAQLPATGAYTILVRDYSVNRIGKYNVNLTCLGSTCAPSVTLSLAPNPLTITANSSGNLTVTIGAAQSTATAVTLSSSNTVAATVPATVTIPANATSAIFPVTGIAPGSATITATLPASLGGGNATASVMVTPRLCLPNSLLPVSFRPFSQVYYITGSNAGGDRLVVGIMPPAQRQLLNTVPLPDQLNQRFCDPIELAPGLLAIAYVPKPGERNGDFNSFAGQLLDPVNNMPFPNGIIPANRLGDPHAWRVVNQIGGPAFVSAASYSASELASESIVAAFGSRMATGTRVATSQPLPTALEGSTVKVRDSAGVERLASLFFVSPDQINLQVPPGTANGIATVTITSGNGSVSIGTTQLATVTPGLFAANANGRDVAAGVIVRVKADGTQIFEAIARFDSAQNKFVSIPIDLGPETEQVFLIPFGTGFRARSSLSAAMVRIGGVDSQVLYAGETPGFIGLDQLNVRLPRSLIGRGEVDVALIVDRVPANIVRVSIR